MTALHTAGRVTPYLEELLENSYARERLREAARNLRGAYGRFRKPRPRWRRRLFLVGLGVAALGIAIRIQPTRRMLAEQATRRDDDGLRPTAPVASMSRPELNAATRSELYQEAKRLGVRGRSKMTKAQLRAAVTEGGRP
jgi:ferric-dicitrate binding protein FerR (iron transport regulator)